MAPTKLALQWFVVAFFVTSHSSSALRERGRSWQDYTLRMRNFNNVQYSSPVVLGEQSIPVIYDTGSFEVIVLSTRCAQCSREHVLYDSSRSSSFSSSSVTAEHYFGSGVVTSELGRETIHVGTSGSPYSAYYMPFWQVVSHDLDVWEKYSHFSGIVGMGHPSYIPEGYGTSSTPEETMASAMRINRFSVCLERGHFEAPGWIMFGPSVDERSHSRAFTSLRIIGQVHWAVRMTGFKLQGHAIRDPCASSCGAIVDSGTSLIAAPPSAKSVVAKIASLVKRDCSNVYALPVLQLTLDGTLVELPPKAYVMRINSKVPENASIWDWLEPSSRHAGGDQCFAAFMNIDKASQAGPVWILGMPFLRYYYTVFDRGLGQIHIAEATPACSVESANSSMWNESVRRTSRSIPFTRHRVFTAADYEPNIVDLNEARIPGHALRAGGDHI